LKANTLKTALKSFFVLGPALGSYLYNIGGFTLPYIVVASMALIMAVVLTFIVPKVYINAKEEGDSATVKMTFTGLLKVTQLQD
jgi:predicted MFS family arabinose efflux permease